ncbi:MAG TPA: hypothetical protein VM282_13320 [Acidimicrobiales bacterium]|nr:hypothetical protein [Acidimicrobiales bacterium]
MFSTLVREIPIDYDEQEISDDLLAEIRVAELVMALSGCSARRAIALVRDNPMDTTFDRLVYALAATRSEIARSEIARSERQA